MVIGAESRTIVNLLRGREHQRPLITQIHFNSGLILKLKDKLGIHFRACRSQGSQGSRHFENTIGQHTGRGVRRLAAGLSPLH